MKAQIFHTNFRYNIHNYFIAPALSGLWGFTIFFSTLLVAKGLGVLVGSIQHFNVELADVEMSLLGFVFLFLIRFLKNYLPKDS
ncbi:MAG TPA: hypothetical protein ENI76_02395 [Ignavibacteria bacterium]|nr:hypothetical protein [Ignavibacteria bacterium]